MLYGSEMKEAVPLELISGWSLIQLNKYHIIWKVDEIVSAQKSTTTTTATITTATTTVAAVTADSDVQEFFDVFN